MSIHHNLQTSNSILSPFNLFDRELRHLFSCNIREHSRLRGSCAGHDCVNSTLRSGRPKKFASGGGWLVLGSEFRVVRVV